MGNSGSKTSYGNLEQSSRYNTTISTNSSPAVNGYATTNAASTSDTNEDFPQTLSQRIISQMWISQQQAVQTPPQALNSESVKLHNQWVSESKKVAAKHYSSAASVPHFYDPVATTYQDVSSFSPQHMNQVGFLEFNYMFAKLLLD